MIFEFISGVFKIFRAITRIQWNLYLKAGMNAKIFGRNVLKIMDFSDVQQSNGCQDIRQEFCQEVAHLGMNKYEVETVS